MHVGLIRSYGGKLLTKTYRLNPPAGRAWESTPSAVAGTWEELDKVGRGVFLHGYREQPIDSLQGLRDFLMQAAGSPDIALIQGRLRDGATFAIDTGWHDVLGRQQENYEDYPRKLLVLDADEIAGDIIDAPDIVRDWLYAIPEFDGCAHVACFSPSAGVKPGIRVRIFVVTSEEHTLASQRAFIAYVNERNGYRREGNKHVGQKLFDDSIYGPQSFTALAAPLLVADTDAGSVRLPRPVPQPVAWFFDGDEAEIGVSRAAAQIGLDPRDIEYIEQYGGPTGDKVDWFAEIAPGNVAIPLHRALCRAAFVAPDAHQAQHFASFVAAARRRLLEIEPPEFARREREHLNIRQLQTAWDKARARRQTVTPAYSAKPQPPATPSALTPRQQLAQAVAEEAASILAGKPMQIVVASPPGAGKSHSLRGILKPGVLSSNKITTAAPTHELADQLTTDHKEHAASLAPGGQHYGIDLPAMIRHHKGRKLLCTNEKHGAMAERAEALGLSVKKTACAGCPDRHACAWIAQASDDGPGERLHSHAALFNRYVKSDEWGDLTILDENITGSVIDDVVSRDVDIATLEHKGGYAHLKDSRRALMNLLLACMPRGQSERAMVPSTLPADTIEFWLQTEETHRTTIAQNSIGAVETKYRAIKKEVEISAFVTALLENMRDSRALPHYKAIRVFHARGTKWVTITRRQWLQDNVLAKGAIHLDGTAKLDPDLHIWKAIMSPTGAPFPYKVIDVRPTPGNVRITQVVDASFAKSSLLPKDDPELNEAIERAKGIASAAWITNALADDPSAQRIQQGAAMTAAALTAKRTGRKKRADSRLYGIWLTVLHQAFTHSETLLVAQKDVLAALSNLGLPGNVRKAHFGMLRGLNHYKDVPAATIVGRPALDNNQLELYTEAIFVQDNAIACVPHADAWGKQTLPVQLTDGSEVQIQCDGHPDARCRALQALISHAEVAQAVARIRPYDRTEANPCDVVVFGQWPVGLPVDRVCALSDVRPEECEVALVGLGVFDDVATSIDVFSGLYKSEKRDTVQNQKIALDFVRVALRTWLQSDDISDTPYSVDLPLLPTQQAQAASVADDAISAQVVSEMVNLRLRLSHIGSREGDYLKNENLSLKLTIADALNDRRTAYQFVELLIVGNHEGKRAKAKKVVAITRTGLTAAMIEARTGLQLAGMRKLTPRQVRKYGLQLVRGLVDYECKRSPALKAYADQITDDVGMLEFIEMWCGWNFRG